MMNTLANRSFLFTTGGMAVLILLLAWVPVVLAAPSVSEVEALIAKRDLAGARSAIEQVIQEKPNSAKAYYLYAQILHAQKHDVEARTALGKAELLDPKMSFASPDYLARFKSELGISGAMTARTQEPSSGSGFGGLLWPLLGVGLVILAVAAIKNSHARQQRRNQLRSYSNSFNPNPGGPYSSYGQAPPPQAPNRWMGAGAGFLGGLAAGSLLGHIFGNSSEASENHAPDSPPPSNALDDNSSRFDTGSLGDSWDDGGSSSDSSSGFDGGGDDW